MAGLDNAELGRCGTSAGDIDTCRGLRTGAATHNRVRVTEPKHHVPIVPEPPLPAGSERITSGLHQNPGREFFKARVDSVVVALLRIRLDGLLERFVLALRRRTFAEGKVGADLQFTRV